MTKIKQMSFKNYIVFGLVLIGIYTNAQQVVTTEEAVELTLEYNYGIKITNNTVEVAENNTSILNSGYLPTLTGNAGAIHNIDNTEAEFSNGETTILNGALLYNS